MQADYFRGKEIVLMGLGLLGRGIGDAKFFAEHGANLLVTDLKTEEELADSLQALQRYQNITYHLGGHRLEDFRNADLIVRAANVPLDSPFLEEAKRNGVCVTQSTALFAELTPAVLFGVTGSKGKTTVTYLLHEILKRAFPGKQIFLGGNVQGVSTLSFLDKAQEGDIAVLELDSWQLRSFGDAEISPHIAVFTNFLPDHLNYYKGDMDAYLEDKAQIFLHQKKGDILIIGKQAADIVLPRYKSRIASEIHVVDESDIGYTLSIPGEHNRYNAACAAGAARVLGTGEEVIRETAEHFRGVPGRLEFVREVRGVKYYNDTTATMPDAVVAALEALDAKKIVLVAGGSDKNIDPASMIEAIRKACKAVVLLPGTGTNKLLTSDLKPETYTLVSNMQEAVSKAREIAQKGDTVLLSPGFASFGLFQNEYDRGEQFNRIVGRL